MEIEDAEHEEEGDVVESPESEHHGGGPEVTNISGGTGEHVNHGGVASQDDPHAEDDREDDQDGKVENPDPRIAEKVGFRLNGREGLADDVEWPLNSGLFAQVCPVRDPGLIRLPELGVKEQHHFVHSDELLPPAHGQAAGPQPGVLLGPRGHVVLLHDPGALPHALHLVCLPLPGATGHLMLVEAPLHRQALQRAGEQALEEVVTDPDNGDQSLDPVPPPPALHLDPPHVIVVPYALLPVARHLVVVLGHQCPGVVTVEVPPCVDMFQDYQVAVPHKVVLLGLVVAGPPLDQEVVVVVPVHVVGHHLLRLPRGQALRVLLVVGVKVSAREIEGALQGDGGPELHVFVEFYIFELVVFKCHLESCSVVSIALASLGEQSKVNEVE